jgi:multidrug efflux system membrane fusion protein
MPNSAVRRGAPNGVATTFVYIVNADRTVAVRPVTLGVVDGEKVAVTAGLKAGEVVVTEGGDRLREGTSVVLPGPAPAAASAAAAGAQPPAKPGVPGTTAGRRGKGRGKPPPP